MQDLHTCASKKDEFLSYTKEERGWEASVLAFNTLNTTEKRLMTANTLKTLTQSNWLKGLNRF